MTRSQHRIPLRRLTSSAAAIGLLAASLMGTTPAQAAEETVPVMVILDASGSMLAKDAPGLRIDAAKDAVKNLINTVPDDARMGLMVYGSGTDSSPASAAAGCKDIKTLAPIGNVNKSALVNQVDGIKASGYTPVGASLRAAGEALQDVEGPRSIVLVSDGIDTCAPPAPCKVAQELADQGLDLTIHSIGFKVDAAARDELECISKTTGGTYADAQDAEALTAELTIQTRRAMNSYEIGGTPISGGETIDTAPEVQPGQYVDQLVETENLLDPADGTMKYYRVRLEPGERAHFAASFIRPQDTAAAPIDNEWFDLRVDPFGADGESCGDGVRDYNSASNLLGGPPTAVYSSPAMGSTDDGCFAASATGDIYFQVVRKGGAAEVPVELSVVVEPASDSASLPEPHNAVQPVPAAQPAPDSPTVEPGYSYGTATSITEGSYSSALIPNELHIYKIELDYGQQLAATLKLGDYERDGAGIGLQLNATNPLRTAIDFAEGGNGYRNGIHSSITSGGKALEASMAAPVRFTNRESTEEKIQTLFLNGDYYLLVSSDAHGNENHDFEIPYTLAVEVTGTPEDGPTLLTASTPTPTATAEPDTAGMEDASAEQEPESAGAMPWILGGAGVLLLGGLAAYVLLRRTRGIQ